MKKVILVIFAVLSSVSFAQWEITGGMGLQYVNQASIKDYLDFGYAREELADFNSTAEFWLECGYEVNKNFKLGIDYAYRIYGYSTNSALGFPYEFDYTLHAPTAIAYYVIPGEGYEFRFGGGIGIRYIDVEETRVLEGDVNLTSWGFGLLGRVQALTKLGDNVFAVLGGDIRADFPGEPEYDGGKINYGGDSDPVNGTAYSIGVKIGVNYKF